ncbi:HAMP domain-containing histidine kinase [Actinoallomurus purpureus]|uniref:sensor histidine kinase n=1 Tax=Actinoallomurus purpureus TaxID=478114 RepID=UPI002091F0FE|nr:HAMP domain-containing sensor histidine kinase [Actinoallomurus purpureus]MCO6009175.1 HAMP domain-containing histidine kinase [Actinoallomurus purpureus]
MTRPWSPTVAAVLVLALGCLGATGGLVLALAAPLHTGIWIWVTLALVVCGVLPLGADALLTREIALRIARPLLDLPRLAAERRTAAADLAPLADDLRRAARADRLLLTMSLPVGDVRVDVPADDHGLRPDDHGGLGDLCRDGVPHPIPPGALPDGWRAGVYVAIRAGDGRDVGSLLIGWTRLTGPYRASRMVSGVPSGALTDAARALGAFWNGVWNRHDIEEERARLSAVIDPSTVFVDESKRRRLEDSRHLLLDSIRHELHGPLTVIRGHAQLLGTVLPDDRNATDSLEAILDAVEMMHHVVRDLAAVGASDPSALPAMTAEPIDVTALLHRTLRAIPSVAARTLIDSSSGCTVRADPWGLRQCLLLALGNAQKYAPDGKITVTVREVGSHGVIGIADEGPDIPHGERALVLQPYYRAAADGNVPGSGLGLYIADVLMTAMGGRIELATAPSGGLQVDFWVPLSLIRARRSAARECGDEITELIEVERLRENAGQGAVIQVA